MPISSTSIIDPMIGTLFLPANSRRVCLDIFDVKGNFDLYLIGDIFDSGIIAITTQFGVSRWLYNVVGEVMRGPVSIFFVDSNSGPRVVTETWRTDGGVT